MVESTNLELEIFRGLSFNVLLGGKRIGFIDAWEDEDVVGGVWVEYVYILEWHRNQGLGSKAVKKAIRRWGEAGYTRVTLNDIHWEKPQDFWGGLGFTGKGKRKSLNIQDVPWL